MNKKRREISMSTVPVIDVHTHMLSDEYIKVLEKHGGPRYTVKEVRGGQMAVHLDAAPFMTLFPEMFDYDLRVKNMTKAGVEIAIVSLTCPNVFWGSEEISASTARLINKNMQDAQSRFPDRIRWFATIPWQFADAAVAELETAVHDGAVGVMVLGNIAGTSLTDPMFAPVWEAIDKRGLPVLLHPTAPQGLAAMDMVAYNLVASSGFMFDTTLALSRMIFDGFFERYQKLKIIGAHGGAALPYFIGRLDRCHEMMPACREKISEKPSTYMRQVFIDSVVYQLESLKLGINVCGEDNVMYGSDYPHNIGDMAGCLGRVNALDASQRDKVRGRNAMRIFNL
jgi:aminocarboxymuconate-semialdehyde decarboxylase